MVFRKHERKTPLLVSADKEEVCKRTALEDANVNGKAGVGTSIWLETIDADDKAGVTTPSIWLEAKDARLDDKASVETSPWLEGKDAEDEAGVITSIWLEAKDADDKAGVTTTIWLEAKDADDKAGVGTSTWLEAIDGRGFGCIPSPQ